MNRLTRTQLATAIVLWKEGKDTHDIMRFLNARRAATLGNAWRAEMAVHESAVANSLAAWREEKRKDATHS